MMSSRKNESPGPSSGDGCLLEWMPMECEDKERAGKAKMTKRKRIFGRWFVMMTFTAMTLLTGLAKAETIQIRPYEQTRPFEGWGTSLCWWANRIGYSEELTEMAARAFFDEKEGLGLNIVRYNIGGGDDETHHHITRTDSAMEGYAVNPEHQEGSQSYQWDWDWEKDAAQRNVLEKAREQSGEKFIVELFSNSPPYFMTVSGCSSGHTNPNMDNLKEDAYDAFAEYLVGVAEHFENVWHIPVQSLEPMNEPYTNYWKAFSPKQEGCRFSPGASQSRILLAVRKELDRRGMQHVILPASDETSLDTQLNAWYALSDEAKDAVDRIDVHSYQGAGRAPLSKLAFKQGKGLWMSEVDGGDTLGKAGEMGAALWLAQRVVDDMNGLQPSAWILWQVVDSHISKNGYLGNRDSGMVNVNGGYWGLSVADHDQVELIHTMKYYAFGQFTRYIRPGDELLSSSGHSLAARNPETGKVTLVYVNAGSADADVELDLSSLGKKWSMEGYRTSGSMRDGEKWTLCASGENLPETISLRMMANAVTTVIFTPVP